MGEAGEGQNINHQLKKMSADAVRAFRDRFNLPVSDEQLEEMPYLRPEPGSAEAIYFAERRRILGGQLPARLARVDPLPLPPLSIFNSQLQGSGDRGQSTTMGFVRILTSLLKDPELGRLVIPIVPDESRTFGMEGLFRQIGIHSYLGQLKASTNPVRSVRGSPPAPPTATMAWPRFRSTSSIRCSGCSASATWHGPRPMRVRAVSCWAPPPAAPR
ncbi:hypothetical protein G6F31_016978 [Rhizopus arrhizus]|nr:hypothetical protein G6F31_016978 [Rhizopus arrhizus]